ncbi:3-hydroxyacyl-ACP dehydratase FabZ [Ideonella sp.]|uniref:3-hydroxyacyl-ACP dehydratase FabZ n=1 Tax=Ideonella sp. TaxID=1929293 RepID=UPI0035B2EB74
MNAAERLDLLDALPHRPPMLLIDRIVSVSPFEHASAEKDVTLDDPWFKGHFPGQPIFPGVLILEAMAQTACVLAAHSTRSDTGPRLPYLVGVDHARFRRLVQPGDRLDLSVRSLRAWGPFWRLSARAEVNGELAAEATLTATLAPAPTTFPVAAAPRHAPTATPTMPALLGAHDE